MTATSNEAGIELGKLEALARAATPGPWFAQAVVGYRGNLFDVRAQYQRPIAGSIHDPSDATYIAAANPAAVLQLIALARRAPAPDDERAEQCMQIAHRWAQAAYCKALNKPGEDIDTIKLELRSVLTQQVVPTDEREVERLKKIIDAMAREAVAHQAYVLAHQAAPAQPALTVWYGSLPESNGKSNFTAILMRKDGDHWDNMTDGITIDHSEYPDRVRYEADRVRYLIGELTERPFILDYDADKHSGYVAASAQPSAATREQQLEAAVRAGFDDIERIHKALGLPDADVLDADKIVEAIIAMHSAAAPTSDQQAGGVDVETLQEQSDAWFAVCDVLHEVVSGWTAMGENGMTAAVAAIRYLVAPAAIEQAGAPAPNCGACPGDGSICKAECRLRAENPPVEQAGARPVVQADESALPPLPWENDASKFDFEAWIEVRDAHEVKTAFYDFAHEAIEAALRAHKGGEQNGAVARVTKEPGYFDIESLIDDDKWPEGVTELYMVTRSAMQGDAQPVLYQYRTKPEWEAKHPWSKWEDCTKEGFDQYKRTPCLNDWLYEARALFAAPTPATDQDALNAKRYRWLRDDCPDFEAMTSYWLYDELDEKIDAALAATPVADQPKQGDA